MYGDGSQTRSFCYVSDLVEGLIRQLAEQVWVRINLGLSLVEKPLPDDDLRQRRPMIDLARQPLGWQPTVALEQELEATIDSFRKVHALEGASGL